MEYLKLCIDGKYDEVRQRLSQLPKCVNWLDPALKMQKPPKMDDDDSDSMSDDDDESFDEDMDTEDDGLDQRNQRNAPQVDDDGFILVDRRRR